MVKKLYLFLFTSLLCANLNAQVGINNTDPKAQLDISSTSESAPEITDGILIPRISSFPAATPTADQHGMMVFLNTSLLNHPEGFYYWDQVLGEWSPITANAFTNFYKEGTVTPSQDITEGIYRLGNTGIGSDPANVKLKVAISPLESHITKTGLEIDNFSSAPKNVTYGILSNNRSLTADKKYGIKNSVSAEGEGTHYGIFNETFQKTNEDIYGIFNRVGKTFGATRNHYGIYSEIGSSEGTGMVYGIYSSALGNKEKNVFAGYFAGRVGIGHSPAEEYILPGKKGIPDQILVMGPANEVAWKSPGASNYTSTTSATGNYIIGDEVYTLSIKNDLNTVTIPEASTNKGRVIVLVAFPGVSQKILQVAGGTDIFDITSNSSVTSIKGGQRLMIQSAGNRWIVIGD